MKVKKIKDDPNKEANLSVRVDGFRIIIGDGRYKGPKGTLAFKGIAFNAVPTRQAREIAIYLCKDGRLYKGERFSGRPASLPTAPLVDKLMWFTIEPGSKSLAKSSAFIKDFIDFKMAKGPEKPPEPKAPVAATADEGKPDEALYVEDDLDEMEDAELVNLAAAHGSRVKKRAKVIDFLLTLTQADALPPDMMYDPVDLDDLDDEELTETLKEYKEAFTDRAAALSYLKRLTADGDLLDE
jgi:hypothetical protein